MIDKNSVIMDKIKSNIFPATLSVIAMFIWRDISELRSDVKSLLAQSSVDKTKIENLERIIYNKKMPIASLTFPVLHDKYFKHEDFYYVEKYIAEGKS
jgi:hypothetical protein